MEFLVEREGDLKRSARSSRRTPILQGKSPRDVTIQRCGCELKTRSQETNVDHILGPAYVNIILRN